ncbi:MAG: hypothetical protein ACJ77N_06780 [Chloroflexota bacterium]|jgi:hypothetical protein
MSDDRSFDRIARWWLETGPTEAPQRVVDDALLAVQTTSQERDFAVPRRLPTMNVRLAAFAAVVVLAVGGTAYLLRPSDSTVATPPPSASPSPAPRSAPPASAGATAPIPEGSYVGPKIQAADIIAYVNADTKLTAKQKTFVIDSMFGITKARTWAASLEFNAGKMTQRQSVDGEVSVGSGGAYSFLDSHTLVVKEDGCNGCYLAGFTVSRVGDSLTLTPIGPPADESDAIALKYLFGSGPFTREP